MHKCIVCELPMTLNTQPTEPVVTECGNASCSQPCIHGWLERQNQHLCPVCKSVVGGNRLTPIFGSENSIDDNRNNVQPADRRTELNANTGFLFNLGVDWTYFLTFIIILAILSVIFLTI
ncbi:hypothetical protein ACI65C_000892 [Semiaphis heraclei]